MTPERIRAVRKSLGLSAEAFACAVGVANGRLVRKWEAGDIVPGGTAMTVLELTETLPAVREWMLARAHDASAKTSFGLPPLSPGSSL